MESIVLSFYKHIPSSSLLSAPGNCTQLECAFAEVVLSSHGSLDQGSVWFGFILLLLFLELGVWKGTMKRMLFLLQECAKKKSKKGGRQSPIALELLRSHCLLVHGSVWSLFVCILHFIDQNSGNPDEVKPGQARTWVWLARLCCGKLLKALLFLHMTSLGDATIIETQWSRCI